MLTDKELLRAGYNLRGEVCREMVLRRKEIEPFITGMFDAYVEAMALEGCWGGKPHTLITVCHHHILLEHAAHVQFLHIQCPGETTEAMPIRLCLMETHAHAQMETRGFLRLARTR